MRHLYGHVAVQGQGRVFACRRHDRLPTKVFSTRHWRFCAVSADVNSRKCVPFLNGNFQGGIKLLKKWRRHSSRQRVCRHNQGALPTNTDPRHRTNRRLRRHSESRGNGLCRIRTTGIGGRHGRNWDEARRKFFFFKFNLRQKLFFVSDCVQMWHFGWDGIRFGWNVRQRRPLSWSEAGGVS